MEEKLREGIRLARRLGEAIAAEKSRQPLSVIAMLEARGWQRGSNRSKFVSPYDRHEYLLKTASKTERRRDADNLVKWAEQ